MSTDKCFWCDANETQDATFDWVRCGNGNSIAPERGARCAKLCPRCIDKISFFTCRACKYRYVYGSAVVVVGFGIICSACVLDFIGRMRAPVSLKNRMRGLPESNETHIFFVSDKEMKYIEAWTARTQREYLHMYQ